MFNDPDEQRATVISQKEKKELYIATDNEGLYTLNPSLNNQ